MTYNLTVITPPTSEPLNAGELSAHMKLDQIFDRPLVIAYGTAGRHYVEAATRLTLAATTYEVAYDGFDHCRLRLPRRPVSSVVSVKYTDPSGTEQTLSPSLYDFDQKTTYSFIRPKENTYFPATACVPNSVRIRFVAGPATTSQIELAKLAIRTYAAYLYENREAVGMDGKAPQKLPHGLDAIISLLSAPEF